jgi:hypothetical protein
LIGRYAAALAALGIVLGSSVAARAAQGRRRFEPTDLRLQPAGVAELDLQVGPVSGEDGRRLFAPDFETSIGIGSHIELEVDGTFGLDDYTTPIFLDNTLVAVRVEVLDEPDGPDSNSAWSAGFQAGPRLPTLPDRTRIGFEELLIVGRNTGRMHVFFQAGTIVDPLEPVPGRAQKARPVGIEGGIAADLDLDEKGVWSLTGELGAIKYLSPQLDQCHVAGGPQLQVTPWLDVSIVGRVGVLTGGDRLGLFLGADARFKAF